MLLFVFVIFWGKVVASPKMDSVHGGQTLMLNERIANFGRLRPQLVKVEEALSKLPEEVPFSSFAHK